MIRVKNEEVEKKMEGENFSLLLIIGLIMTTNALSADHNSNNDCALQNSSGLMKHSQTLNMKEMKSLPNFANTVFDTIKNDETWSGEVYINNNIVIPENVTLIIAPGTEVYIKKDTTWESRISLTVYGSIIAIGTEENYIRIKGQNSDSLPWNYFWKSIKIFGKGIFNYCDISDGYDTITLYGDVDSLYISNCIFSNNNNFTIVFYNTNCLESEISNNIFYNNGAAIGDIAGGYTGTLGNRLTIKRNLFYNNWIAVSWDGRSKPIVLNNTIISDYWALVSDDLENSESIVKNNIIYGQTYGLCCFISSDELSEYPQISYNNFYNCSGGSYIYANTTGVNTSSDYDFKQFSPQPGIGEIHQDPLFLDYTNNNYHLSMNSPCIDAGDPNSPLDPDGTRSDIGAYYFFQGFPISISVDYVYAFQNDTILVGVNVDFLTDSLFSSVELSFGGFQGSLEFVGVDTSNSLISAAGWDVYINDTDTLLISASGGADYISGEGTLFKLKFYVPDTLSTGFIPIIVTHALFDETDLYVNIVNGGVNVLNPTFYGDVSLNGEIHAYDASLILKYLVGIEELNTQQLLNANVSLDNSVSALDASLIFQYVVGLIDTLPYDTTMESLLASGNIAMNDCKIQSGQHIDVSLLLTGGENILSFEGLIEYNPEHLAYNEIVWSDLLDDFTIELNEDNGNIKIAGAGSVPDGQEGLFASIHFTVDDNFNEAETIVEVKKLRWNEEAVMEDVVSAVLTNTVGIGENQSNIPKEYALQQNFPNPFNPTTTISYQLPKSSFVKLAVYDINGRLVETLVNEQKNVGYYSINWNAVNISSGIYIYKIEAGEFSNVKKCLIVK